MKKIGMMALFMIGLVLMVGAVSAYGWHKSESVKEAIENKDFDAWKSAMMEDLTEERFDQIVERHENMPEGKEGMMRGEGKGKHGMQGMQGKNADPAVKEALEAGDFEAWKSAHENMDRQPPFEMTEANFNLMLEMHESMESGDFEKVGEIRDELGLGARHKQGGFFGQGK